jgi:hypothetical protein
MEREAMDHPTDRTAEIIAAVCDTFLPSLEPPAADARGTDDPEAAARYYRDGAAARGIDRMVVTAVPALAGRRAPGHAPRRGRLRRS